MRTSNIATDLHNVTQIAPDKEDFISKNGRKKLPNNAHNRAVALREHAKGVFGFDTFTAKFVYLKDPPWPSPRQTGDPVAGACYTRAAAWMDVKGLTANRKEWIEAVEATAHRFSSLDLAIARLPPWHGVDNLPRRGIDTWLIDYCCGVPDTPVTRLISRMFYLGLAKRIIEPGSKVQTVLILDSPKQGAGKSRLVEAMAEPLGQKLTLKMDKFESKDDLHLLQGRVLIEIDELAAFKGKDVERLKAMFSTDSDTFRVPYGSGPETFDRACVFIGTTNEKAYLRDTTGNRRYMPITVGQIDVEGFKKVAAQLLAEAIYRVKSGERYWVDNADEAILEPETEKHIEEDSLQPAVVEVLWDTVGDTNTPFAIHTLMRKMNMPISDSRVSRRIGQILQTLGYEKKRTNKGNLWVKVQPANAPPDGAPEAFTPKGYGAQIKALQHGKVVKETKPSGKSEPWDGSK